MPEKLDTILPLTESNYQNQATDDKDLFRVVDRNGDWTHYYHEPTKRYLVAVNHVLHNGFPKGAGLLQWLKKMTEADAEQALNSAAERGANVHSAIRALTSGQPIHRLAPFKNDRGDVAVLTNDEWDCLLSWAEWAKVFKPMALKYETALYNLKYGFAGTGDLIGSLELPAGAKVYIDDKLTVIKTTERISGLFDYKTGGTYDDHKLQVSAYAACLTKRPQGKFYTGVVRLGTRHANGGYEVRLWSRERTKEHFQHFLNALTTYKFVTGSKEWEPEIRQIPLELKVVVPQIKRAAPKKKNASPLNEGVQNKQGQGRPAAKDKTGQAVREGEHKDAGTRGQMA